MKLIIKFFIAVLIFTSFSCGKKRKIPNVSNIKVDIKVLRFEKDFFEIDTTKMQSEFNRLNVKYGDFLPDYLYQILGLQPQVENTINEAKLFLRDSNYNAIYRDATKSLSNISTEIEELKLGLQLTKYYFPNYKIPNTVITFVGPVDGYGCVLTGYKALAVGLQGFMGKDYFAYQNGYIAQTYPAYQTKRFERQYIATNCINNVINEMYPLNSVGKPLAERFVEAGKRMYLLDHLLPNTNDTIKTGYTTSQLKDCYKNEAVIWSYFVQNNLLYEKEHSITTPYVSDGPKTAEINDAAPGNIGQFVGWQIVKKWMDKNKEKSLKQLMKTPAMSIFNEAGYAP